VLVQLVVAVAGGAGGNAKGVQPLHGLAAHLRTWRAELGSLGHRRKTAATSGMRLADRVRFILAAHRSVEQRGHQARTSQALHAQ
jgi:hypothetical protein